MTTNASRPILALAVLAIIGGGCGGRDLYQKVKLTNPPLERGFVYMSRDHIIDAGQDPVEFGSPVVTKDTVYVATETKSVEAFERASFRRKWQFSVKDGVSSELLLDNNVLYFGANDGNFYALDADFGKVIWKYETKAPVYARATIFNQHIYFQSSDDIVYCLNASDGKWIWHYKRSVTAVTSVRGNSTPALEGNTAYVGFSDGYVVALNANDGNLIWEQKIHKGTKFTDVDAMPLLDDKQLYCPSYDGELYALDKTRGAVLWHIDIGGSKKVLMDDKTLYLASSNGNVYSVNKENGRVGWKFELDQGTPTAMVQRGNFLAFGGSQGYFYAIHKGDGSLAYRYSVGTRSGFVSSPFSFDREIYILSGFGNLYVFRWTTASAKETSKVR